MDRYEHKQMGINIPCKLYKFLSQPWMVSLTNGMSLNVEESGCILQTYGLVNKLQTTLSFYQVFSKIYLIICLIDAFYQYSLVIINKSKTLDSAGNTYCEIQYSWYFFFNQEIP